MNKKNLVILILLVIIGICVLSVFFPTTEKKIELKNDTATSDNHNDVWKTVNSVIAREKNGTLITRGESDDWFYLFLNPNGEGSNYLYSTPFTIEFDVINETYRSQIEFRDEINNAVSNFEFNSLSNRGLGHWKIIVNSSSQQYYHDGELVANDNQQFSDKIRIGFVGINGTDGVNESSIKFANFKIY